jgi:hypothetical protein
MLRIKTISLKAPRTLGVLLNLSLVLGVLAACDPFEVTNPGPILDESLDDPDAGMAILTGIVADVEVSLDNFAYFGGVASTDLNPDATRPWVQSPGQGSLLEQDGDNQWDPGVRARWVAEEGISRLLETQEDAASSPIVAAAYLWAGFASRLLGDNVCVSVVDGGPATPNDDNYTRAIQHFQEALDRATAIGASVDSIRLAAIAGLAQSNLILENYSIAAGFAAQIPDDFLWLGHRSDNSNREENQIFQETHQQKQVTVWGTYTDSLGAGADPRVPFEVVDPPQFGASGLHPFHRQLKYSARGTDIPLAKGPEMRLIEAEVLLRGGDRDGAMTMINQVRQDAGVADVTGVTDDAGAWLALDRERHLVLWMEGRRLRDNDRLSNPPLSSFSTSFMAGDGFETTGGAHEPRDRCFPPSRTEVESNPNLGGGGGD